MGVSACPRGCTCRPWRRQAALQVCTRFYAVLHTCRTRWPLYLSETFERKATNATRTHLSKNELHAMNGSVATSWPKDHKLNPNKSCCFCATWDSDPIRTSVVFVSRSSDLMVAPPCWFRIQNFWKLLYAFESINLKPLLSPALVVKWIQGKHFHEWWLHFLDLYRKYSIP